MGIVLQEESEEKNMKNRKGLLILCLMAMMLFAFSLTASAEISPTTQTNTSTETKKKKSPKTGDNVILVYSLAGACVCAVVAITARRKMLA